ERFLTTTHSRLSVNDGTQDAGNQADELRAWAQRAGGTIVAEYVDQASGAKSAEQRPGLASAISKLKAGPPDCPRPRRGRCRGGRTGNPAARISPVSAAASRHGHATGPPHP